MICRKSAAESGGRKLVRVRCSADSLDKLNAMINLEDGNRWRSNARVCVLHFKHREKRRFNFERDFDFEHGGRGTTVAVSAPRDSPTERSLKRKRADNSDDEVRNVMSRDVLYRSRVSGI